MFDGHLKQGAAYSAVSKTWIDQDHPYPGEMIFIDNGRSRSDHPAVNFGYETSLGAGEEKALPICLGLVPLGEVFQAHPIRNVLPGHLSHSHDETLCGNAAGKFARPIVRVRL